MTHFDPVLSRRHLLRHAASASLAGCLLPSFALRRAGATTGPNRVLVCLFQRGAVDGLNMVVPYREPAYYSRRPSIAVPPPNQGGAIDLDGTFALHPALSALHPYFVRGELAVVHACGSTDPTRSHFDAQEYMENGTPGDKTTSDGWLSRHLQTTSVSPESVFRAVALQNTLPLALAGNARAIATKNLEGLAIGRGRRAHTVRAAIETMFTNRTDLLGSTVADALDAVDVAADIAALPPDHGAEYPGQGLGPAMQDVARLIKSDVGLEIAFVDVGGWDTHTAQGGATGTLANLLGGLADALAEFRTDLGDRFADVCVVTLSEFGLTVAENGSGGTDHGHGTAMLVHGGTVRGGRVYGDFPGLDAVDLYEGRDLAVTTDFRLLLAELVAGHLGNDRIGEVFPGFDYDPAQALGIV